MNRFISPILNLKVTGDTEKFNIYDPESIEHSFMFEKFVLAVGAIEIGRILNHPVWYIETDVESNLEGNLHKINASRNNLLCIGFWLIKDCACMSPMAILFNDNDAHKDFRNTFIFNSSGRNATTCFDDQEINQAFILYTQLYDFIGQENKGVPVPENSTIRSAYTAIPYNNIENIERAILFINQARYTSHIPQKISWYIVAIEVLFGNNEPGEIVHKVSYRTALFFDVSLEEKLIINDKIKLAYGLRSKFLHGAKLDKKHVAENVQIDISNFLDNTLRQIFTVIINDVEKRKIFLDNTTFDQFFKTKMFGN